jgi:hypothetical protein
MENLNKATFVHTIRKKLVYINRETKAIKNISPEGESIEGLSRVKIDSDWSIGVFSTNDIRIFNEEGECTHTHHVEDKITCVEKGNRSNRIIFCVKDSVEKKQNIYTWNANTDTEEYVCSIYQEAAIQGIFEAEDGRILCWDAVSTRPTFIYLYEKDMLYGPYQNPNLCRSPSNIIAETDGFVFSEKDSMYRWNLVWRIPTLDNDDAREVLEEDDTKILALQPISSVAFVLENLIAVLEKKKESNVQHTSTQHPVFIESARHGMNLFYQHNQQSQLLVWVGDVMRDFSSGVLFENGRITLKKNRELIVLQLMKGDTEVPLQVLFE